MRKNLKNSENVNRNNEPVKLQKRIRIYSKIWKIKFCYKWHYNI